jgi:hypothetical protein
MVVFVPTGDLTGEDKTRHVDFYDGVWRFLLDCGARELVLNLDDKRDFSLSD